MVMEFPYLLTRLFGLEKYD